MRPNILLLVVSLCLTPSVLFADDDSLMAPDDAAQAASTAGERMLGETDSEVVSGSGILMAPGSSPLAYGVVYTNGQKQSGSSNWTSTYNSTYTRYEISITGENYYYLNYATTVTPAGDIRYCRTDSVSGKLLVYCFDKNGNPGQARFGFATHKP